MTIGGCASRVQRRCWPSLWSVARGRLWPKRRVYRSRVGDSDVAWCRACDRRRRWRVRSSQLPGACPDRPAGDVWALRSSDRDGPERHRAGEGGASPAVVAFHAHATHESEPWSIWGQSRSSMGRGFSRSGLARNTPDVVWNPRYRPDGGPGFSVLGGRRRPPLSSFVSEYREGSADFVRIGRRRRARVFLPELMAGRVYSAAVPSRPSVRRSTLARAWEPTYTRGDS